MRILVTNDDGIDAPGLKILTDAARSLTDDVWVAAPATEQSGQSHAIILVDPLRYAALGDQRFAVSGTPADCVAMAMSVIMDGPPDLVVSGVNQGFNIANDMLYSGTVGAAMQAATSGVRAIAFSQAYQRLGQEKELDIWDAARTHCAATLKQLAALDMDTRTVLNVNFPPCPASDVVGLSSVKQGNRALHEIYTDDREDGRGHSYHWLRFRRDASNPEPGTDLWAMAEKRISVTPLHADLTAHDALPSLAEALDDRS